MKKFFIAALFFVFLAGGLKAQDLGFGGGLIYGTDVSEAGIDARADIPVSGPWVITPNINIFFIDNPPNVRHSFFTINVDAHYHFDMDGGLTLYPLGGLNFASWAWRHRDTDFKDTDTALGFNLGGGLDYNFSRHVSGLFELKFIASEYDQAVFTFGILYHP